MSVSEKLLAAIAHNLNVRPSLAGMCGAICRELAPRKVGPLVLSECAVSATFALQDIGMVRVSRREEENHGVNFTVSTISRNRHPKSFWLDGKRLSADVAKDIAGWLTSLA